LRKELKADCGIARGWTSGLFGKKEQHRPNGSIQKGEEIEIQKPGAPLNVDGTPVDPHGENEKQVVGHIALTLLRRQD
jgi:hypothetical protein